MDLGNNVNEKVLYFHICDFNHRRKRLEYISRSCLEHATSDGIPYEVLVGTGADKMHTFVELFRLLELTYNIAVGLSGDSIECKDRKLSKGFVREALDRNLIDKEFGEFITKNHEEIFSLINSRPNPIVIFEYFSKNSEVFKKQSDFLERFNFSKDVLSISSIF